MKRIAQVWIFALVLSLILPLGGCTSLLKKDAPHTEKILVEAGFKLIPANTPKRVAQLQALPPYKVVKRVKDGATRYVYADPNCQCVYVGGPEQYATFNRYFSESDSSRAEATEEGMVMEEQEEAIEGEWGALP